jgi:hypothetical protein
VTVAAKTVQVVESTSLVITEAGKSIRLSQVLMGSKSLEQKLITFRFVPSWST